MKISTAIVAVGAGLFVLPVPGTFVLGALVMIAGGISYAVGRLL